MNQYTYGVNYKPQIILLSPLTRKKSGEDQEPCKFSEKKEKKKEKRKRRKEN